MKPEAEAPKVKENKPPEPAKNEKGEVIRAPAEWCARLRKGRPGKFGPRMFDAMHEAASALHGWRHHEHHEAKPIMLTEADYQAALEAAGKGSARHEAAAYKPRQPKTPEASS